MSCFEMKVREFLAETLMTGTSYGRPGDLEGRLASLTGRRSAPGVVHDLSRYFETMRTEIGRDPMFNVGPIVERLDQVLAQEGAVSAGELGRSVNEASRLLIDLVEGYSAATREALKGSEAIATNEPNSHELEESIVDGFLAAVQGAMEVWGWDEMRGPLKERIAGELLRPKGETDFPGSVFVEEDRERLLPFLEGVRIGGLNVFDALAQWYDTHVRFEPERPEASPPQPLEGWPDAAGHGTTSGRSGHE